MKVFFRFFRDYPRESILAPLFKLLEAGFDLLVPLVIASIIDRGIGGGDTAYILRMAGVLVLLAFVGLVSVVTAQYFAAKAAVGTAANIRRDLFAHMQSFTYTETDGMGIPTMITRMTSDVNQVQSGINMALRLTLRSPVIVFGSMIVAFTIDVRLALIFAAAIPVIAAVVFGIMLGGIPLYKKVQTKLDEVTGRTRENLGGVRVIRAYRREQDEIAAFDRITGEHTVLQNRAGRLSALMNPLTYVLINLAVVLIIYCGAPAVDTGRLTQGEVVALVNYMGQILIELVKLANLILLLTKAAACSARVQSVLEMPVGLSVIPEHAPAETGADTPAVSFDHVSLTYSGGAAPSLCDVTFSAPAGSTVGIIGGTGAGKTSLVNLIPRFYEATEGSVRVMGHDVSSYDPADLRAHIGAVPQKAELFRGTIRSNLLWGANGAPVTDDDLWRALDVAQAADFVREKDGGLDAPVEQKGRNFSGGQKQRLTIARALVGSPDILILDDSASALDFATDAALRKALRTLDGMTTFIISQRTSSIRACDQIIVLDEGRVAAIGTHEDLLASCPLYREIHESQFGGGDRT